MADLKSWEPAGYERQAYSLLNAVEDFDIRFQARDRALRHIQVFGYLSRGPLLLLKPQIQIQESRTGPRNHLRWQRAAGRLFKAAIGVATGALVVPKSHTNGLLRGSHLASDNHYIPASCGFGPGALLLVLRKICIGMDSSCRIICLSRQQKQSFATSHKVSSLWPQTHTVLRWQP